MLARRDRLAMQYSPRNAVMYVGLVDAGTIEMLRDMGKDHRQLGRPGQPV